MDICPKCGLPKEACICNEIAKSSQKIRVKLDKRRYGKAVTIIEGFGEGVDVKKISKSLKSSLACGGTYKGDTIEIQGDHMNKIKKQLIKLGFDENLIEEIKQNGK